MTTQPFCVCTDVATCEICTVHASVCVCACVRKKKSRPSSCKEQHVHAPSRQLHHTHTHTHSHVCAHTHKRSHAQTDSTHTRPTHTPSSSCAPFSMFSWALPVTPHGDFALCQLSYSNKPLRHSPLPPPRFRYWLKCDLLHFIMLRKIKRIIHFNNKRLSLIWLLCFLKYLIYSKMCLSPSYFIWMANLYCIQSSVWKIWHYICT